MDFLSLKQLVVDCTKLIPGMRFSDKQKPHCVTFCKVVNIIVRHSGYTYIIPCTGEINAAGVIDIFEKHIKPTIGLPLSIVLDQDVICMSAEFQDWMIKNSIRYKVSTTYHPETDGKTKRTNRELTDMWAAHELEGTDWVTAVPEVQTQVNTGVSKSRAQSPFFTCYGLQNKVNSTELPHPISVYLDPAQRQHSAAEKLNSPKHNQIKYANTHRRPGKYHETGDELMLPTKNLLAHKFKLSKLSTKWTGPLKVLEYNHKNQNVSLDFSDFSDLSNISNKLHTSLLKPLPPNDDIHFPESKLNRPGPVEEDRWELEKVHEVRSQPKTGKPQYKVQRKGWPTKYNQWLYTAYIEEDLIQQFWLHGSKTATHKRRKTNKSTRDKEIRQGTLDMINKARSRALRGIAEEEEPQAPQPVEGISSAFLHAYLDCMTHEIQKENTQRKESSKMAGFIECFDNNEGYYQVPHKYC